MGEVEAATAVTSRSTTIRWDPLSRVALVAYTSGSRLVAADGPFLVDALAGWIGASGEPFAVMADAAGLVGTDAAYRASVNRFFKSHRASARIALINVSPMIHVVVEMLRIGAGIQIKPFATETLARAWLRTMGVAA
jgi:hypothetical protein